MGLKYDHHAYLVFENLNSIQLPSMEGVESKELRINVSKAFSSYINMNKDDLVKLVAYEIGEKRKKRDDSREDKHQR